MPRFGEFDNPFQEASQINTFTTTTEESKPAYKILPTSFRTPTKQPETPYIKDAKIERIEISGYPGFYADIVISIDGVPDERIIEINHNLTHGLFEANDTVADIREKENRVFNRIISEFLAYRTVIKYIDKNYIQYRYEDKTEEWSQNFDAVITTSGEDLVLFGDNSDKVLQYFYPNGEELYGKFIDEGQLECFKDTSFPSSFEASIKLNTKEIIYEIPFVWMERVCRDEFPKIAIPIKDILREVPQYVPEDSVLWEFK